MSEQVKTAPHRSATQMIRTVRRYCARMGLLLAVLAALTLCFAGFGVHEEMFDLDYAVRVLATGWAPNLGLLAIILGVLALLAAVLARPPRDGITSLVAIAIGACVIAVSGQVKAVAAGSPPIHDVATDWSEPLMFGPKVMAARGELSNAVEADPRVQPQPQAPNLTGTRIADVNARTCPGAAPVVLTGSVEAAYAKAKSAVAREGLAVLTDNPAGGRLEAMATTHYLKLKGDVLVRVKPEGSGARVDLRSISRTGIADLGENCRRVTRLRKAIGG